MTPLLSAACYTRARYPPRGEAIHLETQRMEVSAYASRGGLKAEALRASQPGRL